jgi:hypothetical protein
LIYEGQANENLKYAKKTETQLHSQSSACTVFGRTGTVLKNGRDITNLSTLN